MFQQGDICEGLISNPDYPAYTDVYHLVRVIRYSAAKKQYLCESLAFNSGSRGFWWREELLSKPREAQPVSAHMKNVDVRIFKRTVEGELVDGLCGDKGVWVKGCLCNINGNRYMVEHYNWETGGTTRTIVTSENIRPTK